MKERMDLDAGLWMQERNIPFRMWLPFSLDFFTLSVKMLIVSIFAVKFSFVLLISFIWYKQINVVIIFLSNVLFICLF